MRLHIVGLPHTRFTPEYSWCAYTTKISRFTRMMVSEGFSTITYGNGDADLPGKYVKVTDESFPDNFIPDFDSNDPIFSNFNSLATAAIISHASDNDILCIIGGLAQAPISWALPQYRTVEYGIGYSGHFSNYRIFESHAWHHAVCGEHGYKPYDAVIHNYFDTADFTLSPDRSYFAFLGRVCNIKGIDIAIEACQRADVPLKIAGHVYDDAEYVKHLTGNIEYVGELNPTERKDFLSHSIGTLTPTRYCEPFCGVHVEAMLSGSPPITPDYGVFTETVPESLGYRCTHIDEYEIAALDCLDWSTDHRAWLATTARNKFSMDVIAPQYTAYFERLENG